MISVIIPIYLSKPESYAMTEKCINLAKENARLDIEWIIVETESDFFKDQADIHIYEKERTTCTESINRGFKIAKGGHTVLLTNDVFLKPGWDEKLLNTFAEKKDCGMATLATSQLGHVQSDLIEEGVWCSVFMIPSYLLKELGYFDEGYVNSWDDTDLVMRVYLKGMKMYRNFGAVVEHTPGKTMYQDEKHRENYKNNMNRFADKYRKHKENRMFKILYEGWVI